MSHYIRHFLALADEELPALGRVSDDSTISIHYEVREVGIKLLS